MATAAAAGTGQREKVIFAANQTEYVKLMSHGSEQESRDGAAEWRYFLHGARIMWVPEEAHRQIERIAKGNGIGAELAITKYKSGKAPATWIVQPMAEETPGAAAIRNTETAPASREPVAAAAAPPAAQPRRQEPTPGQPAQSSLPSEAPFSTSMYTCLCAAIRTAAEAEKFALQLGRPIAFETSDVRAIAATLFIHATGGR